MYSFNIIVKSKVPKSNHCKIKSFLHMIDLLDKPLPEFYNSISIHGSIALVGIHKKTKRIRKPVKTGLNQTQVLKRSRIFRHKDTW